jgi:hypothetical protein
MHCVDGTAVHCCNSLEAFAAELTSAAYTIASRHGIAGSWLDLELALWRVLTETAYNRVPELPRAVRLGAFAVWRTEFLAELTAAACRTTLRYGVHGSFRDVEVGLYRAFRSTIGDMGRETLADELALRPARVRAQMARSGECP